MKNLTIPAALSGYMGIANLMANPDLQTRIAAVGVLMVIMTLQAIVFANATYLPKWYQRCQVFSMVFVFAGIVFCIFVPGSGLVLSGVMLMTAFIGMLMAAAVVTIMRDQGEGKVLMKKFWYLPLILLSIVAFMFFIVEKYQQKYGDNTAEHYAKIAATAASQNKVTVDKTLDLAVKNNRRNTKADSTGQKIISSVNELNQNVNLLIGPIHSKYNNLYSNQQQIIITQQKQQVQLDKQQQQLDRIEVLVRQLVQPNRRNYSTSLNFDEY